LLKYGAPKTLIADNGVQWKSKAFQALLKKYQITYLPTPYFYPRANPSERVIQTVKTMIRSYVGKDHRKWDTHLAEFQYALRSNVHDSTGFSPAKLFLNRELSLTGQVESPDPQVMRVGQPSQTECRALVTDRNEEMNEIKDMARAALKATQLKNKGHYDVRRRPHKVTVGQLVWRKNHVISDAVAHFSQGLAPKNVGPFIVSRDLGSNVFALTDLQNKPAGNWHCSDLQPFSGTPSVDSILESPFGHISD